MKTDQLRDSELIHYASLSDDPEKRRLAEIAADGLDQAKPWETLATEYGETAQSVADSIVEYRECFAALDGLGAITKHELIDQDYLQYLARLSKAVNDGRVQLVEDCGHCDGTGRPTLHPSPDPCLYCDGRGVTFTPADSDSV